MIHTCITRFFKQKALLADMFETTARIGAASASILDNAACNQLLAETRAEAYAFMPEIRTQGKEGAWVYQEVETFANFPENSGFLLLKNIFEACLGAYADLLPQYPFSFAPIFNAVTLARYPAMSIGITPHRDPLKYKNLICIFVLGGKGKFFLCTNRSGSNVQEIDASAGNIIFLRSPGFMGINKRPFHFLTDIKETRYSFILRQEQI